MRQISTRYLSQEERIEIADLRRAALSIGDRPPAWLCTVNNLAAAALKRPAGRGIGPWTPITAPRRDGYVTIDAVSTTNDRLSEVVIELLGRR